MPVRLAETTIKAAMQVAAGKSVTAGAVSAAVAQLTEGVLKTMTLKKVTVAAALVLTAGSVGSGIALLAMGPGPRPANAGPAAASPAQDPNAQKDESRPKAGNKERVLSINNLTRIGLAMHTFVANSKETRFPPAAIRKDGKPLLSCASLFCRTSTSSRPSTTSFISTSPGTARTTRRCSTRCPKFTPRSCVPMSRGDRPTTKCLLARALCSRMSSGQEFRILKTDQSNTFMVVEAGSPVPWTKPEDISYDKEKPLPKLGRQFDDGFHAAFADGSVRFLGNANDPDIVRRLITT